LHEPIQPGVEIGNNGKLSGLEPELKSKKGRGVEKFPASFYLAYNTKFMKKLINHFNRWWNRTNFWFHDLATKTNIRWIVSFSIWTYDHLHWSLSEKWQLIGGVSHREYMLQQELELALHQAQYYANYAYELQWSFLEKGIETIPDAEQVEQIEEVQPKDYKIKTT
jgi:hypothetical protein